ncbi:sialate O-acetylesterase [Paenibacillus mendelii]|uniref:Sialate O-acetylesterase n=1 Tax=Paenibacillus mendelii TaxID=206163 RepID=A0ABV6JFV0_9BACL|nr:sialate O-acetylesterase [Paenibacillus mendelii]MCQ6557649.1 sialate O-acetylesterase [Paenibacillus mendelii]
MPGIYGMAGVVIDEGPGDWQIIQQINGEASIRLAGAYAKRDIPDDSNVNVIVRLVSEDSGEPVKQWQQARLLSEEEWTSTQDDNGFSSRQRGFESRETPSGYWETIIEGIPAGGLYRIETMLASREYNMDVVITRGDMIHHIGIGDIYLIAGQSNASGRGKDPVMDPPEIGVHMFRNSGDWSLATHPLNESTRSIYPLHYEYHNPSHSPYLNFAKQLKRELGYPIGLIQSALGGMPLRFWDVEEEGELYHNMIQLARDAAGGRIRGVLWYQGCTDALEQRSDDYLERFGSMVERTRAELGLPELPFLTVQLNRCTRQSDPEMDMHWGRIREAQRKASRSLPEVYVVPATDCMLYDLIHNSAAANMMLGERLARMALTELYDRGKWNGVPDIEQALLLQDDGRIALVFANVHNRFHLFDLPPASVPFTIEDEAGRNDIAVWFAEDNRIYLTPSRPVIGHCVVHGVWQMNPPGPTPTDWGRLPILSFYGVEVQQGTHS